MPMLLIAEKTPANVETGRGLLNIFSTLLEVANPFIMKNVVAKYTMTKITRIDICRFPFDESIRRILLLALILLDESLFLVMIPYS